ncbi:MAG TPA: hypothetical protein VEB86_19925 [Chryseosolibacter sp.]|nr:hypothetical protein [Chryseosolibacter sp.]
MSKEPVNAAAHYLYSTFFFRPANPAFHVDSAYLHIIRSLGDFSATPPKGRERLKRLRIDSASIVALRAQIDSAAFARAKEINTEEAFRRFLAGFPHAAQRAMAVTLRDEAAYLDAVKANTYEAFLHYYNKYPDASHAAEALAKYHQLLFEAKTRSQRLADYEKFLEDYPSTPYRNVVEKNIFEISTASGEVVQFVRFISRFPGSSFSAKARNIAFHLLDDYSSAAAMSILTDSLRRIITLNEGYLAPVLKEGRFSFMNARGQEVLVTDAAMVAEKYRCGNIADDVLIVGEKLIGRDGAVIFRDSIAEIDDMGAGFLKLLAGKCWRVTHKSGFTLNPCVADAKIIAGRFVALKQNDRWFITTLAGKPLSGSWEEITSFQDIIAFTKNGKIQLCSVASLASSANGDLPALTEAFDDIRPWGKERVWVRKGTSEGVLDPQLNVVIPLSVQALSQSLFGAIARSEAGARLLSEDGREIGAYRMVTVHQPWLTGKGDSTWLLMDHFATVIGGGAYDSIRFVGPFAIGMLNDSSHVFLSPTVRMTFAESVRLSFIPGRDSVAFLVAQQDRKKTVYGSRGQKLFTGEYDDIQYAGDGLFIVSRKEKKGLAAGDGKLLLPVDFDAIGGVSRGMLSLLKGVKFGAYHIASRKLIKPQYDKNIVNYNPVLLAAFQKGKYKFVGWDNKPVGKIQFDEIEYWTDTIALVKNNFTWSLYNTLTSRTVEAGITNIEYIVNDPEEKLAKIKQDNGVGVLSSRRGEVIPATFTNVVNVGSREVPLFFTEKHVEEALIFVVIYYDAHGKMLLRRVYEEADYEKILCSDN